MVNTFWTSRSDQQCVVSDGHTAEELCSKGDGLTYKWVEQSSSNCFETVLSKNPLVNSTCEFVRGKQMTVLPRKLLKMLKIINLAWFQSPWMQQINEGLVGMLNLILVMGIKFASWWRNCFCWLLTNSSKSPICPVSASCFTEQLVLFSFSYTLLS